MLAVIGCGNPNREDDGVGVAVVQRLADRLRKHPVPGVRAFDCGTAGMEVMFAARGADALLVVDACTRGEEAGAIYEVPGEELEALPEPAYTLHGFRWDHALAAGRRIFREDFPDDVRVYLVQAERTGLGLGLSPAVDAAAERLYARLLDDVATYAAGRHGSGDAVTVRFARGSLHLPAEVYRRFFDGRDGAVLLPRDGRLTVMPVEQVAGGVLVKLRNARGDRAVAAAEALRHLGWDDTATFSCTAAWDPQHGVLTIAPP